MKYNEMENVLDGLVSGIASDNVEKSKSLISPEQISKICEAINSGDLDEIDSVSRVSAVDFKVT